MVLHPSVDGFYYSCSFNLNEPSTADGSIFITDGFVAITVSVTVESVSIIDGSVSIAIGFNGKKTGGTQLGEILECHIRKSSVHVSLVH